MLPTPIKPMFAIVVASVLHLKHERDNGVHHVHLHDVPISANLAGYFYPAILQSEIPY